MNFSSPLKVVKGGFVLPKFVITDAELYQRKKIMAVRDKKSPILFTVMCI